jgi:hypothetical protein
MACLLGNLSTPTGHRKVKGNMDIELTVGAMELAGRVDYIVLFPATEIFARWSNPCSDAVFASRWSPRFPAGRQCLPTNFAARRTTEQVGSSAQEPTVGAAFDERAQSDRRSQELFAIRLRDAM